MDSTTEAIQAPPIRSMACIICRLVMEGVISDLLFSHFS